MSDRKVGILLSRETMVCAVFVNLFRFSFNISWRGLSVSPHSDMTVSVAFVADMGGWLRRRVGTF